MSDGLFLLLLAWVLLGLAGSSRYHILPDSTWYTSLFMFLAGPIGLLMLKFNLPPFMNTSEILEEHVKNLLYISETDDYWKVFAPTDRRSGVVTCAVMSQLTGLGSEVKCDDSYTFDGYLQHLIYSQGVSQGDLIGKRYINLYNVMTELLDARKVFKFEVSPHRYRYYVVGLDYRNSLVGIFADSVET